MSILGPHTVVLIKSLIRKNILKKGLFLLIAGLDTTTYDIWSFVLLIAEPFFRPMVWLLFYFKYLKDDPSLD